MVAMMVLRLSIVLMKMIIMKNNGQDNGNSGDENNTKISIENNSNEVNYN